jgi:NTE family protein
MKIGLVLGSGSSRGWAHIGVLKALADENIQPDILIGCSIGALTGAAWCCGRIQALESWALSLKPADIFRYLSFSTTLSGVVNTEKVHAFLHEVVVPKGTTIEGLKQKFATVASNIATGREFWFTSGSVLDAVQASMAFPGLFPAWGLDGEWYVDGGLINPVPVNVCRALGADFVIAVNLNSDIVGKHLITRQNSHSFLQRIQQGVKDHLPPILDKLTSANEKSKIPTPPTLWETLASSVNIMQDRITNTRLASDPPDIIINPALSRIGLFELHRAAEAIEEGYTAAKVALKQATELSNHNGD